MNAIPPVIPEEHEQLLRTAFGADHTGVLDADIEEKYWELERTMRRLGLRISGTEIAFLVVICGMAPPPPPKSFMDVVNCEGVKNGDRVIAEFRKEWQWGWYRGLDVSVKSMPKIKVELDDGASEVRRIGPTKVRLPRPGEKLKIGEQNGV